MGGLFATYKKLKYEPEQVGLDGEWPIHKINWPIYIWTDLFTTWTDLDGSLRLGVLDDGGVDGEGGDADEGDDGDEDDEEELDLEKDLVPAAVRELLERLTSVICRRRCDAEQPLVPIVLDGWKGGVHGWHAVGDLEAPATRVVGRGDLDLADTVHQIVGWGNLDLS